MTSKRISSLGFACVLALCLGLVGCGDDDDDGSAGASGGGAGSPAAGSGGSTAGSGGEAGTTPAGNNTMTGITRDLLTNDPVPNVTIRAMDNTTGDPLGIETTSGADGSFTVTGLPDGDVGLMVVGNESAATPYMDVYYYNIPSDTQDREILVYPMMIGGIVDGSLGPADPETGGASGEVRYEVGGETYTVDCVVISVPAQPDALVYYVNDQAIPDTTLTEEKGRTIGNGRFYIRGLAEGPATIVASTLDGTELGTVTVPIALIKEATGGQYNSNSTYILLEGVTSDPTPDCPE